MLPAEMKWGPAPPALPPGAQAAVLAGDPGKEGTFVIRAKLPAGYRVPPHWHPVDELRHRPLGHAAARDGRQVRRRVDAARCPPVPSSIAAKEMRHYVQAKGPTVIQVSAMGPFAITYVNPADDPRTKTQ